MKINYNVVTNSQYKNTINRDVNNILMTRNYAPEYITDH